MLSIYKLRAKHTAHDAYWRATILAPDLLTAALFLKRRSHADDMPTVHEKNGRKYTTTGNKAYYRNAKLDLLRLKKKSAPSAMKKELEARAKFASDESEGRFHLCKILDEVPFSKS